MSILRTVTLNAGETVLMTLQARDNDASTDTPTRNFDAVQPPGSNVQGVFGTGIHTVSVLERDFALCNMTGFASAFHAKAALEAALINATSIRTGGWELPLAASAGIVEWQHLLTGLRARLRLVPRSAHWRLLTGTVTGDGYQGYEDGYEIDATGLSESFSAAFVGRLLVFTSGEEALITEFVNTIRVRTDVSQIVGTLGGSVAFTVYHAVTGLL